jgi:hypoxanthine phosphoribosyltransferase
MSNNPYDYENRQGTLPIAWNDFHGICRALAKAVSAYQPDLILPIGRGGFYPGTLLSHLLRIEIYPIRLSRRVGDVVLYEQPQWIVRPPQQVKEQRVLVVDEISSTGETLQMVKAELLWMGAKEVRSAVMYAHSGGTDVCARHYGAGESKSPDYIGIISDAFIMNPWDRELCQDGEIIPHPEYISALTQQGIASDPWFLIPATTYEVAKQTP